MKKTSSLVWRFFDRLEENKRCVAVLCKLCDTQYKYFGNTTNLRTHLLGKHPIQWELLQNGSLDESTFRTLEDDENASQAPKRRKYLKVDVLEHSETDIDNNDEVNTTMNEHVRQNSDEEWLEDDWIETYEPNQSNHKVKYRRVKREVTTPTSPKSVRSYVFNRKPITKVQPRLTAVAVKKDEYSVFGEYIANKLRKFKSYQTSVNVQQLITTILWQAEYGVYDDIESVKRIVLSTVQEMDTTHNNTNNKTVEVSLEGLVKKDQEIVQSVIDRVRVVEG